MGKGLVCRDLQESRVSNQAADDVSQYYPLFSRRVTGRVPGFRMEGQREPADKRRAILNFGIFECERGEGKHRLRQKLLPFTF